VYVCIHKYEYIHTYVNNRRSGLDVYGTQNARSIFHSFFLIYTRIYTRIYVYKYICVYVYIYIYKYIHTYVNNRCSSLDVCGAQNGRATFHFFLFDIYMYMYTHICIYTRIYVYKYICVYVYIQTYKTYIHT